MAERSAEVASACGGHARCIYLPALAARPLVPLRYAISAVLTVAHLARCRPAAVIVTNPPLVAAFVVRLCARACGSAFLLDTHPAGFGAQGDGVSARLQPAHRWLARRATCSLVTCDTWVRHLATWGAKAMVLHEAPPRWSLPAGTEASDPPGGRRSRPTVVFAGSFGGDEPMDVVLDAARRCPDVDLVVTGDVRRGDRRLLTSAPANVTFTGFLDQPRYVRALVEADVVVVLSREPTSVMRAAYEAVWACRPLVVTDTPTTRELFPTAVHVANSATGLSDGVHLALARRPELLRAAPEALRRQEDRVARQMAELRDVITSGRAPHRSGGVPVRPGRHLGLPVSTTTWDALERWIGEAIGARATATIVTIAPFQVHLAQVDRDYRHCLDRADAVLVDGNGIRLALALAGVRGVRRLTGRELCQRLHAGTFLPDARVAVVGASPAAANSLGTAHPEWLFLPWRYPPTPDGGLADRVVEQLEEHRSSLVLVALRSPASERWADALAQRHAAVYASVGGGVDTAAGLRRSPPPVVRALWLEWLWRLGQDPTLLPRVALGLSAMPGLLRAARRERRHGPDEAHRAGAPTGAWGEAA